MSNQTFPTPKMKILDIESPKTKPNPKKTRKPIFLLALTYLFITTQQKKIKINKNLFISKSFHWASQNGTIFPQNLEIQNQQWTLRCEKVIKNRNQYITEISHANENTFRLILEYLAPYEKPLFLVHQQNVLNDFLTPGDRFLPTSPKRPIRLEIFEGDLLKPDEDLCDVKGLRSIVKGINKYNHYAKPNFKIDHLHTYIDMIKFDEKPKIRLKNVESIVFSNFFILKKLKIDADKIAIKSGRQNIQNFRDTISRWISNITKIDSKFQSKISEKLPSKIKDSVLPLLQKNYQKIKLKISLFIKKISNGDFDKDLKTLHKEEIKYFENDIIKKLKSPMNLIYSMYQDIFKNSFYNSINFSLQQFIKKYLDSHMHFRYMSLDSQQKCERLNSMTLFTEISKLFSSISELWKVSFINSIKKLGIEAKDLQFFQKRVKDYDYKIKNYYPTFRRIIFRPNAQIGTFLWGFLRKYLSLPVIMRNFKFFDLQDIYGNFISLRFAEHLLYFGYDYKYENLKYPIKIPLFKAVKVKKHHLI